MDEGHPVLSSSRDRNGGELIGGSVFSGWSGTLVRLRAIEPEDGGYYQDFAQDIAGSRSVYMVEPPRSRERVRKDIERLGQAEGYNDCFALAVESIGGQGMIGAVSTHRTDGRAGTFSYGLGIGAAYRRRGYGSAAARILLTYMFTERRYHKCLVEIHADNAASLRLHDRLGFVQEGLLREQEFLAGRHCDVVLMGLLRREFLAAEPADARSDE
ncbi:GNAT family N-acetyltransferase [Micromonospora chalcea]|uniref:GNAT family N-acetyltransferase n=1 Tax=Micromonospora TaxID=1873 RepID=UPI001B37B234|nr:GNAT family protein [Micromonospora sp. D75]MBQ1067153.1 GNAT family N-acetyltransferase [Micromonospora sp. D75]